MLIDNREVYLISASLVNDNDILLVYMKKLVYHISPSLVSNSDTELELEQAFQAPKSDLVFGQNPDQGHFEKHSAMQSTDKSSVTAAPQKAQNTAFTIDLDGNEEPRSNLESSQRSVESPQRSLESPHRSLLEEAEAVVARLRPASSPYQASCSSSRENII